MRARTFLLLFLVLLLIAAGVVAFLVLSGDDVVGSLLGRGEAEVAQTTPEPSEPGLPSPTPTPEFNFVPVLVANMPLPAGTRIEADFVRVEMRPDDNVAVRAGYIFTDPEDRSGTGDPRFDARHEHS